MSNGDRMDSALEYILSDARGLLQQCPFMLGTYNCRFHGWSSLSAAGSPERAGPGAQVSVSGRRERREGQKGDKILTTHTNRMGCMVL
jgi:hypothetical protein